MKDLILAKSKVDQNLDLASTRTEVTKTYDPISVERSKVARNLDLESTRTEAAQNRGLILTRSKVDQNLGTNSTRTEVTQNHGLILTRSKVDQNLGFDSTRREAALTFDPISVERTVKRNAETSQQKRMSRELKNLKSSLNNQAWQNTETRSSRIRVRTTGIQEETQGNLSE